MPHSRPSEIVSEWVRMRLGCGSDAGRMRFGHEKKKSLDELLRQCGCKIFACCSLQRNRLKRAQVVGPKIVWNCLKAWKLDLRTGIFWKSFFKIVRPPWSRRFPGKISKTIRTGDLSHKSLFGGPSSGTRISLPCQKGPSRYTKGWAFAPKGSKRCFPNGVFQIPHLGLRQKKTPPEGQRMFESTSIFKHFAAFCLADPDHPLNTPLWKTPFRKHRLLLFGCTPTMHHKNITYLKDCGCPIWNFPK